MKINKDKCCGTCEWWDASFYDPEDWGCRTGECSRFPPTVVYSPVEETGVIEHSPWTAVLDCCGEWLQNTEGRTKENRYGYDLYAEECEDEEEMVDFDEDAVYRATDLGLAWLDTKDVDTLCLMQLDREYYNDKHDRFWCDKCSGYVDVDKSEKPKFCLHCGRKVHGCFCGGDRM